MNELPKRTVSDETREKMRLANLGENNPMYGKHGKDNPNYGKPLSDDRKQKISESCKIARAGAGNSSANEYHLTDKNGAKYVVIGSLESFCTEHNISERVLRKYTDKGVIPVNNRSNATDKSINTYGWTFSKIGKVNTK
jgi:hypothetical protein